MLPSSATADVVSSLNDDGSIVAFNFPRILSGPLTNSELANDSEIYVTATPPRPPFGAITVPERSVVRQGTFDHQSGCA